MPDAGTYNEIREEVGDLIRSLRNKQVPTISYLADTLETLAMMLEDDRVYEPRPIAEASGRSPVAPSLRERDIVNAFRANLWNRGLRERGELERQAGVRIARVVARKHENEERWRRCIVAESATLTEIRSHLLNFGWKVTGFERALFSLRFASAACATAARR